MLPANPIERLTDVPFDEYEDALSILFISYIRFPRVNVQFGHERVILVEVSNQTVEALRTIKTEINRFEKYLDKKIKSYAKLELEPRKRNNLTDRLIGSTSHVALRELFRDKFILLDPSLKHGIIAVMLHNALAKNDQQGTSFISKNAFDLLSDSNLKLIEPWEQASVFHRCLNFEQIVGTHPRREPKCSKCLQDNLTVRVYVLDEAYEINKKNNKDLPLFICNLINKKQKDAAITSKSLRDFNIPDLDGDIDVWIPRTLTGIECKLRSSESKPLDKQLGDYANDILGDLKKYIQVGIKHLVVVTNLDENDVLRVYHLLEASVGSQCESLKILHKSIPRLMQMILQEAEAVISG